MSEKNFSKLFSPKTIAVIGASNTEGTVGYSLVRNLITIPFEGKIFPINPKYESVQSIRAYPSIRAIPDVVDMAIIATPAKTVPDVVKECGEAGVKALVIVSAGFKEIGEEGIDLMKRTEDYVKQYGMTVLGPNCMGFMRPHIHLNASFGRKMVKPGTIAFLSQSGALGSAILDWSFAQNVGFSAFVSIGDMMDIGFADLINYFASDEKTESIVIYMESLEHAEEFLSIASTCIKTKPIIVLKAGRSEEGSHAARSHTGNLTGNDAVFDAAFARAGIIRVRSISELFDSAKTLSMQPIPKGNRLAIVTNAGGPGVIATDELISLGGSLATLSRSSLALLDQTLPAHWSHGDPVDVLGDADAGRYKTALHVCLDDSGVDGVLVILTPQEMTNPIDIAKELVETAKGSNKPILTAWMGEDDVNVASVVLEQGNIPSFEEPEGAVKAFMNVVAYGKGLAFVETPTQFAITKYACKKIENTAIIDNAYNQKRFMLTEPEAKQFLANYSIGGAWGKLAKTKDEIQEYAKSMKAPFVMKIASPDILHKTDVGGVVIGVTSPEEAGKTFDEIVSTVKKNVPNAHIDGVYMEPMVHKRFELLIGSKKDPVFGPVIVFGSGGVAVEVYKDTAIGLPPLDIKEARRLMSQTKITTLLSGYRGMSGVDMEALTLLLCRFSQLIMDFPQIAELDINPLAADMEGFAVLDAKILLEKEGK